MHKILLSFIITLLCISLYSQTGTPDLAFTLINFNTAYEVSRGTADATHIEIPSIHNGLPVTRIANNGFQNFTTMTTISIPNSITDIGNVAFAWCTGLSSITIPNSVTTIGIFAFFSCTGLTSITIPNSVTSISLYAFSECTSLTSVIFESPSRLTTISDAMFKGCINLSSITIPNSVTAIGREAFTWCASLSSITIPNSVTTIGNSAFAGCTGLTSITIPNNVTTIDDGAFWACTGLTSITIPNSVTTIGNNAFNLCTSLTSVIIPSSVTTIGEYAFAWCSSLTIFVEAPSQPTGWDANWNPNNRPVVWGYTVSDVDITETVNTTALVGNYPNPFNPMTTIKFEIGNGKLENVIVDIYNIRGQHIRTLVNGMYSTGSHSVIWNGTDDLGRSVSSGMYFYRMTADEYTSVRRMMLLK